MILKESDRKSKFELFQRLNTGGTALSPQEVRNAIMVQMNPQIYHWTRELANDNDFRETTVLTDRAIEEQYDMDLVSRFLVFRKMPEKDLKNIGDIGSFVTAKMKGFAEQNDFNYQEEAEAFRTTFQILNKSVGENAFRKYSNGKVSGGFSISAFEGVAMGMAYHYPDSSDNKEDVIQRIKNIGDNEEFIKYSKSGNTAGSRVPHTLSVGRKAFKP